MSRKRPSNRGRTEILGDILSLCTEDTGKTRIMYGANLSYEQVLRYLEELQSKGLIAPIGGNKYRTTDKGRSYLESYESLRRMMYSSQAEPVYSMYSLAS